MIAHFDGELHPALLELERNVIENIPSIERWFRLQWQEYSPPFYGVVTVKNTGFKLSPSQTNLFPDNFNHLSPNVLSLATQAAMAAIEKVCPDARNLLLLLDNRLDQVSYLEHVVCLSKILRKTGLNVRYGMLDNPLQTPQVIQFGTQHLILEPLVRTKYRLGLADFDPCAILLNQSLLDQMPDELNHVYEQYLLPPIHEGWVARYYSQYLSAYDDVIKLFTKQLAFDPWLLKPLHQTVCADLQTESGKHAIREAVEVLLKKIAKQYRAYRIRYCKPFVIIRPDRILKQQHALRIDAIEQLDEVFKQLEQLQDEQAQIFKDWVIEEGVFSYERIDSSCTQPMVYLIDRYVVGGTYQTFPGDENDQLVEGYYPLGFEHTALPDVKTAGNMDMPNRFYLYGMIARLGLLACAVMLEKTDPDAII